MKENWKSVLADAQIHIGTTESLLHRGNRFRPRLRPGVLPAMKELAKNDHASPMILDQAANDLIRVEPASLKDPQFAVMCAEREVALSHRQRPTLLLTLAQAYRAAGKAEKSRAAANEALAMLPPLSAGTAKGNMRRMLEMLAQK